MKLTAVMRRHNMEDRAMTDVYMERYTVERARKPWIVIENNGAARPPRIHHFDTREAAAAFAKAEQTRWDEEYREWCRRTAEDERRNSEPGRP
jgi:hypothetical protein